MSAGTQEATPAVIAASTAVGPLEIDAAQQEVLLEELEGLTASLTDPQARDRYAALGAEVQAGAIQAGSLATLEGFLDLLLQTGRARRVHGAEIERDLLRLYHRTPRGTAARRATEATNQALQALSGQTLESLLFTVQAPGVYRLGIQTDRCRLALEIDRHGLSVESLEV